MGILARGRCGVKEIFFFLIAKEKFQHIYNPDRNMLEWGERVSCVLMPKRNGIPMKDLVSDHV